jgi:putative endonuclease
MPGWFVYILECDGTALYVGVTTDVERRYREHLLGGGRSSRYTRTHRCLELVYSVAVGDKSLAMRIEYRLKRLTALRKRQVLDTGMPLAALLSHLSLDAEAGPQSELTGLAGAGPAG